MQVLAHNLISQFTNRQLNITSKEKGKSAEKLASGYRINRAADDAAGLKISEKMRQQIRGLARGEQNIQDGISWLQVADGAMAEVHDMLQRINELAIQASNDTNSDMERHAINQEINQLKKEINNIGKRTQFNAENVFERSHASMDIKGSLNDLNIYNATYDNTTGDVTYGGFVFHGERIPWDTVSTDMVTNDPVTGEQIFKGGDYDYSYTGTNGQNYSFHITCEDGAKVPKITRKVNISADAGRGIIIDGQEISWNELKDENGNSLSASGEYCGIWDLDYEGATISFFFPEDVESIGDMADAINDMVSGKYKYRIEADYAGPAAEKAVDASVIKDMRISSDLAQRLTSQGVSYTVCAGDGQNGTKDGIWLVDTVTGVEVSGSYKSWDDLNIHDWMQGSDINNSNTYTYSDSEGTNDTYISFDLQLSDVTSKDSVIDGLDGMVISGKNIRTRYGSDVDIQLGTNILKASAKIDNKVTFDEEKALGRDFDQQKVDNVANAAAEYNPADNTVKVVFGQDVISYKGTTGTQESELKSWMTTYAQKELKAKETLALQNLYIDVVPLEQEGLRLLLGDSHVTTSGHFNDTLIIDSGKMILSDGNVASGGSMYAPGEDGKPYPCAYIDFEQLGQMYQLDDLRGLGFNSTCKTCSNHYSIMFATNANGAVSEGGYSYTLDKQGSDYTLLIDIDSLSGKVQNGTDFAKAIVDITSECLDFHYTQYAAEDSKVYVYDNRSQSGGTTRATFDTAPFPAIDERQIEFALSTDDGRELTLGYTYNFKDIAENIKVDMKADTNGTYVQKQDGSYEIYNQNDPAHAGLNRYEREVTFLSKTNPGTTLNSLDELLDDYTKYAMEQMFQSSKVQLNAEDYTYMQVSGDELANVAIRSVFDSRVEYEEDENGLHIQGSSQVGDAVLIPRVALNTLELGIHRAGTVTYEQAQATITAAQNAINHLSGKRSLYGAWTNRLEHMYSNAQNMHENVQASESRIRDTDMADEIVNHSKHSILEQAGIAMMAQANQIPSGILELLQ